MSTKRYEFDFGFSAVDDDELRQMTGVSIEVETAYTEVEDLRQRLEIAQAMITPLLNNLMLNPEKKYILWEDRVAKVKSFKSQIDSVFDTNNKLI